MNTNMDWGGYVHSFFDLILLLAVLHLSWHRRNIHGFIWWWRKSFKTSHFFSPHVIDILKEQCLHMHTTILYKDDVFILNCGLLPSLFIHMYRNTNCKGNFSIGIYCPVMNCSGYSLPSPSVRWDYVDILSKEPQFPLNWVWKWVYLLQPHAKFTTRAEWLTDRKLQAQAQAKNHSLSLLNEL